MKTDGVDSAFTRIYESTYSEVLRFVASKCPQAADLNDLLQNIYLNFYKRLRSKGVEHVKQPKRYLLRIARDELYRYYGYLAILRRSIPVFSDEEAATAEEELRFLSDNSMEDQITAAELWERIAREDDTTVKILTLYFAGDQKISEIARKLGESESFVKNRLYRTLNQIREEYCEQHAQGGGRY